MEALIASKDPKDDAIRAFKAIDAENKGFITLDDLKRVYANEPDLKATPELMKAMIDEFDMDGSGRITVETFMSIMFS
jgi:Ca2+-binding EF-hand superfamily protein